MPEAGSTGWESERLLLCRSRPGERQKRLALAVVLVQLVLTLLVAPVAQSPFHGSGGFLPAYTAAVFINDLITAVLLFALASVTASVAIMALAVGYLLVALLLIPWALTFPGALMPAGLLDANLQTTAAIAAIRRVGFPLFVITFALLKDDEEIRLEERGDMPVLLCVVLTVAAAVTVTLLILAFDRELPPLMVDHKRPGAAWQVVPPLALVLYATALAILWRRGRTVLDLWIAVVVATLVLELLLLSYLSEGTRLSAGWWAGRCLGLVSASLVLFVLLSETTFLYARLARSVAAERRARESRLATMEAFSASIAHEINQPLASMVTNADAGIRWLDREEPNLAETEAALIRIVGEGHRAGQVVEGIRSMFRKEAARRVPADINDIVDAVLRDLQPDIRHAGASLEATLDAGLPPVCVDSVQIEQVLANLIANALDAMGRTDNKKVLDISSAIHAGGTIVVSVGDTGGGIDAALEEAMFEPFVTTKPRGLGMGLVICRSIVEAHGGNLWTELRIPVGTYMRFTLPKATPSEAALQ